MTSRNASKTGSIAGIVVKPQKGTTLKVMPAPNVQGKPFCVSSHQSGNLLTTPRIPGILKSSLYLTASPGNIKAGFRNLPLQRG